MKRNYFPLLLSHRPSPDPGSTHPARQKTSAQAVLRSKVQRVQEAHFVGKEQTFILVSQWLGFHFPGEGHSSKSRWASRCHCLDMDGPRGGQSSAVASRWPGPG